MLQPTLERAQVRLQFDQLLRTDAELDAFCMDYFPAVHRRFARGMERIDKVNLLLSVEEVSDIVAKLRQRASQRGTWMPQPRWRGVAMAVAFLALASGGLYAAFHREAESSPTSLPAMPATLSPATGQPAIHTREILVPKGINSGNIILESAGAELRNRAPSGALRDLGATVNSGNRIEGSPRAVISNEVGGP